MLLLTGLCALFSALLICCGIEEELEGQLTCLAGVFLQAKYILSEQIELLSSCQSGLFLLVIICFGIYFTLPVFIPMISSGAIASKMHIYESSLYPHHDHHHHHHHYYHRHHHPCSDATTSGMLTFA